MIKKIKHYFENEFVNHEGVILPKEKHIPENFSYFNSLTNGIFYYHDYRDIDRVHFTGLYNLLGYKDKTITLEQLFDMIHPDDLSDIFIAIKNVINIFPDTTISSENAYCIFTYRLKHKNGNYISVFKDTRALYLNGGKIGAHVNKVNDITYLNISNRVKAWYRINNKTHPLLLNKYQKLFTRREKEILKLLALGKTSEEIANSFYIEKSTVDKHRQNLLAKANVENTMQLIAFSIEHELVNLPFKCNTSI